MYVPLAASHPMMETFSGASGSSAVPCWSRCAPEACHSKVTLPPPGHGSRSAHFASTVHSPARAGVALAPRLVGPSIRSLPLGCARSRDAPAGLKLSRVHHWVRRTLRIQLISLPARRRVTGRGRLPPGGVAALGLACSSPSPCPTHARPSARSARPTPSAPGVLALRRWWPGSGTGAQGTRRAARPRREPTRTQPSRHRAVVKLDLADAGLRFEDRSAGGPCPCAGGNTQFRKVRFLAEG